MINVVDVANKLGYLAAPEGTFIDVDEIDEYPLNRIVIITTGTQGEPIPLSGWLHLSIKKLK